MNQKTESSENPGNSQNKPNKLHSLPNHVRREHLDPLLGFKDSALTSSADQYLQGYFNESQERNPKPLYVPEDCATLEEAVRRVTHDPRITTIVVGKGEHQIDGDYLEILSAMKIVGDPLVPQDEIVILGGIKFEEGISGNCHLQHLTLRQAKYSGVCGESSFTMEDVLMEQCNSHGVFAYGTDVQCTNVEVRQCGMNGVLAWNGASITLIGAKTKVHDNCTKGKSNHYGFKVFLSPSTIQLVHPLTKENVSFGNGGAGNWGASSGADINEIKTIGAPSGETKVKTPVETKLRYVLRF